MTNTNHTMSNGQKTMAFFSSIDFKTQGAILAAIATHYGISSVEAFEEVTDNEAEHLLDYLTNEVRTATRLLMKRHGFA